MARRLVTAIAVAAACWVLAAAPTAQVGPQFTFVDIGVPADGTLNGKPTDINAPGEVVGYYYGNTFFDGRRFAFRYDGTASVLTVRSEAAAINNFSEAVGYTQVDTQRPFVWNGQSIVDPGTPSGRPIGGASRITDDGALLIFAKPTETADSTYSVLDGGAFIDLEGTVYRLRSGGVALSRALDATAIVSAGVTAIPQPSSFLSDLNDTGTSVGYLATAAYAREAIIRVGASIRHLGFGVSPISSVPRINQRGDAIFVTRDADGATRPVLYADGVLTDLQTASALPPGWTLVDAGGINDSGWIAVEVHAGSNQNVRPGILIPTASSAPWFSLDPSATGATTTPGSAFPSTATFRVIANGTPAPTYRWQASSDLETSWVNLSDDSTYGGTGTGVLTVTSPALSQDGWLFRAVATNSAGATPSASARLSVTVAPVAPTIETAPSGRAIGLWDSATLRVGATGTAPLRYQWFRDGVAISLGTRATLPIVFAQPGHTGAYSVTVTNAAGSVSSTAVSVQVLDVVQPLALSFGATKATASGSLTSTTGPQTVTVAVGGGVEWTVTANQPWLQTSRASGRGPGQFFVTVSDPGNVLGGQSSVAGAVTLSAPSLGLTHEIQVGLTVTFTPGSGMAPAGFLDTPAEGAQVSGSVPITGWAMDDVGVNRVEIWRDCVEAIDRGRDICTASVPGGLPDFVLIGRGTFIDGARPDVEARYPGWPQAYGAGWGYLLLTNALPNVTIGAPAGGQGVFRLTVFAVDEEGQYSQLGQRTIVVDNASATVPFGAIDTPEPGGLVPDTTAPYDNPRAYPNFGWALAQPGRCIDVASASSFRVYVDGVARPLTPGVNWFANLARTDVAAAFPGRCNSNGAGAAYYLDVVGLGLANGIHTIGWDVIDDQGQAAGIGSRFFRVLAGVSRPAPKSAVFARPELQSQDVPPAFLPAAAEADRRMSVRRGDDSRPWAPVAPGHGEPALVRISPGERVSVALGGPVERGMHVVNGTSRPLPGGSTLDLDRGQFYWQPPVAFFGTFTIVFAAPEGRIDLAIEISDRSAASDVAELHIDQPEAGATTTSPLRLAGWALDPRATSGTGIDTIHVWATRRDVPAGVPQWLGTATLGGLRPDVARVFGPGFERAGFEFRTTSLLPGVYDVTGCAWSQRKARWDTARTVRIIVR